MSCSHFFGMSRLGGAGKWLGPVVALSVAAAPAMASPSPAPPAAVHRVLTGPTLAGEGQLRFFGLRIYDARLWVGPRFDAAAYSEHPLALELTYHRAFAAAAIAKRSVKEMGRQQMLAPDQAARWQQTLALVLPDVQPGDRLIGLYHPGRGMWLWQGDRELGVIRDAELARLFFGIWLSPRTSEPKLRKALLGRAAGDAP